MSKQSTPEEKATWKSMRGQKRLGSRFIGRIQMPPPIGYGCTEFPKFRRRGFRFIKL